MWIASKYGFFSIVHKEFRSRNFLSEFPIYHYHVRARKRSDLSQLMAAAGIKKEIQFSEAGDYAFRILLADHADVARIFTVLMKSIDYDNFKDMIHYDVAQSDKSGVYSEIWCIMRDYQARRQPPTQYYRPKPYQVVKGGKLLKLDGTPQDDEPTPKKRR